MQVLTNVLDRLARFWRIARYSTGFVKVFPLYSRIIILFLKLFAGGCESGKILAKRFPKGENRRGVLRILHQRI